MCVERGSAEMKYIVMECHPAYSVLLDNEGRFVKACNMNYEIGQSVYEPVFFEGNGNMTEQLFRRERRKKIIRYSLYAACMCIVLFFGVFRLFISTDTEIYVNINPEVKISLNRVGRVISVEGMNIDGEALLNNISFDKKDVSSVCYRIIDKSIRDGYLYADGDVSIYIDSHGNDFHKIGEELNSTLKGFSDSELNIDISISDISQYVFGEDEKTVISDEAYTTECVSTDSITEDYYDGEKNEHHKNKNEHGNSGKHNNSADDNYD